MNKFNEVLNSNMPHSEKMEELKRLSDKTAKRSTRLLYVVLALIIIGFGLQVAGFLIYLKND